jgi:hypothetical protein
MIKILDCTLRDGGYVNDWDFSRENYDHIILELQKTGIDFVEVGLIGKGKGERFSTKFASMEDISSIVRIKDTKTQFAVMVTYGEALGIPIAPRKPDGVEIIRLAYFKPEADVALKMAEELKEKGYIVFLQAMATFLYTDDELLAMIDKVNKVHPYYFCMVDSFGTMYADDVSAMYHLIDGQLDAGIGLGLHAHNNQQLALSNAITFISEAEKTNRSVCVDASIYGMGRGAGNVNLELLMQYFNKKRGAHYRPEDIVQLWQTELSEEYHKNYWGYTWEYFLAAKYDVNSVYIWYLKRHDVTDPNKVEEILRNLPYELRYTLDKATIDSLIAKYA